jgi:hypothetical protein
MKNQSRNFDKILLAEIVAVLNINPEYMRKSKPPFLFNSLEEKDFSVFFDFYGCMLYTYQICHST